MKNFRARMRGRGMTGVRGRKHTDTDTGGEMGTDTDTGTGGEMGIMDMRWKGEG